MSVDQVLVLTGGIAAILWVNWYFFLARRSVASAASSQSGIQEVQIVVEGGYTPQLIRVKAGRPVRLIFDRRETNPCSEEIVLPDFGVRRFLPSGTRTAVEFTPAEPGEHDFSCGMGMLNGKVIVE